MVIGQLCRVFTTPIDYGTETPHDLSGSCRSFFSITTQYPFTASLCAVTFPNSVSLIRLHYDSSVSADPLTLESQIHTNQNFENVKRQIEFFIAMIITMIIVPMMMPP